MQRLKLRLLTDYATLAYACPGVVETLLIQAKRACETTIITGLFSTETLYLVADNLKKLSSLYFSDAIFRYYVIMFTLTGKVLHEEGNALTRSDFRYGFT
ncbi:hypothetical protein LSAT2_022563 [Lamellibrachia satsuma]|nr:hypothetical protein LSAT2_022563 [Lamellibrachia satsuma]